VARDQWATVDPLELHAYPGGKSRRTWRVGKRAWLTASFDAVELEREQSLLVALAESIAGSSLNCRVPEPNPHRNRTARRCQRRLLLANDAASLRRPT
jgi:hypothetical protein